jgi:lysophospholipid acyltransferase (LPLAT)-like uncharacterized protein
VGLVKSVLRRGGTQGLIARLAAAYVRLAHRTIRWTVLGADGPQRLWREGRPFIVCFWHGRMLMLPPGWATDRPVKILISHHRDGRLIARTVARFGIGTVGGSTSRGAVAALRAILRELDAGVCVGITPDGPRGPRMRASAGVIGIARRAGVPVIPATFATSRRRILRSWDRFLLPLPFGRGVHAWGEAIEVARDADAQAREAARRELEDRLNALTNEADRICGHPPVEPGPARPRAEISRDTAAEDARHEAAGGIR